MNPLVRSVWAGAVALGVSLFSPVSADALPSVDLGSDLVFCAARPDSDGRFAATFEATIVGADVGSTVSWDATGPGDAEFFPGANLGEATALFTARGRYRVSAEVEDASGATASDEIEVSITPGPLAHWRLDELQGTAGHDSSQVDAEGNPTGPWFARNASIVEWRPEEGRYGGTAKFTRGAFYSEFPEVENAFSAAFWFNSESWQNIPVFRVGDWEVRIREDGAVELGNAEMPDVSMATASDSWAPGVWTSVALTLRRTQTQPGSTVAKLYLLRADMEPAVLSFIPAPRAEFSRCFEGVELGSTDFVRFGRATQATISGPTVDLDDVRLFGHELSPVEVQDARLRKAPVRVELFSPRSSRSWVIAELSAKDPNLCDRHIYRIEDLAGTDPDAFQILDSNLLAFDDGFLPTPGATFTAAVSATDDIGASVTTLMQFQVAGGGGGGGINLPEITIGGGVGVGGGDPGGGGNPALAFTIGAKQFTPPPPGLIDPAVELLRHYQGEWLATVVVTDVPESPYNGGVALQLVAGEGDTDNALFEAVTDDLGAIGLNPAEGVELDFEAVPAYSVRVSVIDNTGTHHERALRLGKVDVRLNEFVAANAGELRDDTGSAPDWIEIYNAGINKLDLLGWSVSDFPVYRLHVFPPGATVGADDYLILFASGRPSETPDLFGNWHAPFRIARERCGYLELRSPLGDFFTLYENTPELTSRISYGLLDGEQGIMAKTPGAANRALGEGGEDDTISAPQPSLPSGYHLAPYQVSLVLPDDAPAGSTVRYTTDGSEPTTASPAAAGPLTFSANIVLRARVVTAEGTLGEVVTRTYLVTSFVLADPEVVFDQVDINLVRDSLLAETTVSLVGDPAWLLAGAGGLMDPTTGTEAQGVVVEAFSPNGGEDGLEFSAPVGVRLHGRRSLTDSPKQSFRLQFRKRFGDGTLDEPDLFDGDGAERFDNLVLRAGFNNSFTHPDPAQRDLAIGIADAYARSTHRAMGRHAARGRFVHLFLNANYWGVYELVELPDDRFAAAGSCYDARDHDVIDAGEEADGGQRAEEAWADVETLIASFADPPTPAQIEALGELVDMEDLIDFLLLHIFLGTKELGFFSADGSEQNNWFGWRVAESGTGFGFYAWDTERWLEEPATSDNYLADPARSQLLDVFFADPELRLKLADRFFFLSKYGNAFSTSEPDKRFIPLRNAYSSMVRAELARWGDEVDRFDVPTYEDYFDTSTNYRARIRIRHFNAGSQLRNAGLYPMVPDPSYALQPGFHPLGVGLSFNVPDGGAVYFTLDGSDPRLPGGAVSPNAILASAPLPLVGPQTVTARVLLNGEWGVVEQEDFAFGAPSIEPGALRVTEILPEGPGNEDRAAFIEFYNAGTEPILLPGLVLSGDVDFDFNDIFGPAILDPGEYAVVAENAAVFQAIHGPGLPVVGQYSRSLSVTLGNSIAVHDASGTELIRFTPNLNREGWPQVPVRFGFGVVPRGAESPDGPPDYSDPSIWRLTSIPNGSPGRADPEPDPRYEQIVISEIRGLPSYRVELHNTGTEDVDVSGWWVGGLNLPYFAQIDEGSIVPAGGYLALPEELFFSELFATGQNFYLSPVDTEGNSVGFFRRVLLDYDAHEGLSRNRYINSTGSVRWVLAEATLGAPNAEMLRHPLVINEVGGFIEFINPSDQPLDLATAGEFAGQAFTDLFPVSMLPPRGLAVLVPNPIGDLAEYREMHNIAPEIPIGRIDPAPDWNKIRLAGIPTNEDFTGISMPWSNGRSAVRVRPGDSYAGDPASWRASCLISGTPGRLAVLSFDEAMAEALPGGTPDQLTPDADPDGDGLSNAIEVAFATDPGTPGGSPITASVLPDGRIGLHYRRPHDTFEGTDYITERATSLADWAPLDDSAFEVTETPLPDGTLQVDLAISVLAGGDEQFRIRIE